VVADGGSGAAAEEPAFGFTWGAGGPGGEYKAGLTGIPAGTILSIFPGGAAAGITGGTDAGHGGGTSSASGAGYDFTPAGGGGGASSVAVAPFSIASLLVVAGGGGGGGGQSTTGQWPFPAGGAGGGSGSVDGATGGSGFANGPTAPGGGGGTTIAGGANGGSFGCDYSSANGAQLQGGNSNYGDCIAAGGAGGSGYFGGGGTGGYAGGGGGSGFPAAADVVGGITVTPDTSDTSINTGNGVITISYAASAPVGPIVSGYRATSCVGDNTASAGNDTPVTIATCDGSPGQEWTITSYGTLQSNGKCLDIYRDEKTSKAPVELYTCTGGANQQWEARGGTLVNPVSGKCLDDPRFDTTDGTQLEIYTCNGGANQHWDLP
jgi:Ricin-type beta-trefoil lectin domain